MRIITAKYYLIQVSLRHDQIKIFGRLTTANAPIAGCIRSALIAVDLSSANTVFSQDTMYVFPTGGSWYTLNEEKVSRCTCVPQPS